MSMSPVRTQVTVYNAPLRTSHFGHRYMFAKLSTSLYNNLNPRKLEIQRKHLVRKNTGRVGDFYRIGKKLGEGSFGVVQLVETKNTREQRVCKTIQLDDQTTLNELLSEVIIK